MGQRKVAPQVKLEPRRDNDDFQTCVSQREVDFQKKNAQNREVEIWYQGLGQDRD